MTPVDPRLDALKAAWERYRDRPSSLSKDFDLTEHARISTSLLARMTGCYDLVDAMFAAATPSPTVEGGVGLLKRLQNYEEVNCLYGGDYVPSAICREAAAAITRLQAENEHFFAERERLSTIGAQLEADNIVLRERVAKLEEALGGFVRNERHITAGELQGVLDRLFDIARVALTGDSK